MDSVIDYLREKLNERKSHLGESIVNGSSADYSEYRYQVGIIEGLTVALEELKLTEERLYNDKEEGDT
tara:strand:- start:1963 stop:2166 length:204 start_codon:yes stop_codon:yes gene_type:complete